MPLRAEPQDRRRAGRRFVAEEQPDRRLHRFGGAVGCICSCTTRSLPGSSVQASAAARAARSVRASSRGNGRPGIPPSAPSARRSRAADRPRPGRASRLCDRGGCWRDARHEDCRVGIQARDVLVVERQPDDEDAELVGRRAVEDERLWRSSRPGRVCRVASPLQTLAVWADRPQLLRPILRQPTRG